MGILEDVLGSVLGGQQRGGGMQGGGIQSGSPGGLGGMLGGGSQGDMSPIMMALMALLTQQMPGRGGGGLGGGMGGGLGDLLGGLTGQGGMGQVGGSGQIQQPDRSAERDHEPAAGSLGNRGEFDGGHTGMGGLLERLEQGGHGDKATSWVTYGANKPIAPHELQSALGDDTVDQLATQTGMPKSDLLAQLSDLLPGLIDKLTPNGRIPDREEMRGW